MSLKLPSDLDVSILPLIEYLNQHPQFETTLSCSGHYKLCLHKHKKTRDDWELATDWQHQYCSGTSQPFLQFKIIDENDQKWQQFLQHLKDNSQQKFPSSLYYHSKSCQYTYGYSDGDEGFTLDRNFIHEVVGTRPFFYEFWHKFLVGWKKYIDLECDIEKYQPKSFELKWSDCYNDDEESVASYYPEIDPAGDLCDDIHLCDYDVPEVPDQ